MCQWNELLFHCGHLDRIYVVQRHAPNATCTEATVNPPQTINTIIYGPDMICAACRYPTPESDV